MAATRMGRGEKPIGNRVQRTLSQCLNETGPSIRFWIVPSEMVMPTPDAIRWQLHTSLDADHEQKRGTPRRPNIACTKVQKPVDCQRCGKPSDFLAALSVQDSGARRGAAAQGRRSRGDGLQDQAGDRARADHGGSTMRWACSARPVSGLRPGLGGPPDTRLRRDEAHQPVSARDLAMSLKPRAWQTLTWREGAR